MTKQKFALAAACAAALLAACGGGGDAGVASSAPDSGASGDSGSPGPVQVTVVTQPVDLPTPADCPRLTSDSQAAAALDLSDPSIKAISDLLQEVDPVHAYPVFTRRPHDFINWIASSGTNGFVTFVNLGTATHETLHQDDSALLPCAPANQAKYQFFGQQLVTGLTPGSTSVYGIVAETIDPRLTRAERYHVYIENNGAQAGDDFHVLLDELAAYTGGANLEQQYLEKIGNCSPGTYDSNLGGTMNLMVFVENYLKAARLAHPASYAVIRNSAATKAAIQTIWGRAEQVLQASYPYTLSSSSCRLVVDGDYFAAAYSPDLLAQLDALGIAHASAASWSGTYLP